MNYLGNTEQIELLIKRVVAEAFAVLGYTSGQESTGVSPFPLYTTRQVAKIFHVCTFTVRDWHRQGLLHPRFHRISGRSVRFLFTNSDLLTFLDENFPSKADLGHPCDPRSRKGAVVDKTIKMLALYARRRRPTG